MVIYFLPYILLHFQLLLSRTAHSLEAEKSPHAHPLEYIRHPKPPTPLLLKRLLGLAGGTSAPQRPRCPLARQAPRSNNHRGAWTTTAPRGPCVLDVVSFPGHCVCSCAQGAKKMQPPCRDQRATPTPHEPEYSSLQRAMRHSPPLFGCCPPIVYCIPAMKFPRTPLHSRAVLRPTPEPY